MPTQTISSSDMAVAVLLDRMRTLPQGDRDDLFELFKALQSDSVEEQESAARAMMEILDQKDGDVRVLDLTQGPDDKLEGWLSFVSNKIKQLRREKGFTQKQLEELTGIDQAHISRIENGEHSPSNVTLQRIAKALGVPLSTLDPSAEEGT